MKDVLKTMGDDSISFGDSPREHKHSTFRIDKETKKIVDLVAMARALIYGDRRENCTKLFKNLIREEWVRLRNNEEFVRALKMGEEPEQIE